MAPGLTARTLARILAASESTLAAASWITPDYAPVQWHRELAGVCDRIASTPHARMCLGAPPRHGKTVLVGHALPMTRACGAYLQGGRHAILYATSATDRAQRVSRRVRRWVQHVHQATGDPWWAPGEIWTATQWETEGGLSWTALGALSTTGGVGADTIVMDDLIGSGAVYRSRSKREAIWDAVEEDLLSRGLAGAVAVQMETRRGVDDVTGRLLDRYPDVWDTRTWRCWEPDRGYLWPERYGEDWRAASPHLGDESSTWRSLYQQEPVPDGGTIVPTEWLTATYLGEPAVARAGCEQVVIGVDLAQTASTRSDRCAFVVLGVKGARRLVLHARAARMTHPEAERYLRELVAEWGADAVVIERAAGGDALVQRLEGEIRGLRGERPAGSKVTRLMPWLPLMAAGQLELPATPTLWARSFREEVTGFAGIDGEPDDQVDALIWALIAADTARRIDRTEIARSW